MSCVSESDAAGFSPVDALCFLYTCCTIDWTMTSYCSLLNNPENPTPNQPSSNTEPLTEAQKEQIW